jgi:hypothetical protein
MARSHHDPGSERASVAAIRRGCDGRPVTVRRLVAVSEPTPDPPLSPTNTTVMRARAPRHGAAASSTNAEHACARHRSARRAFIVRCDPIARTLAGSRSQSTLILVTPNGVCAGKRRASRAMYSLGSADQWPERRATVSRCTNLRDPLPAHASTRSRLGKDVRSAPISPVF